MILCTAALAMAACTNELTETVGTSTQPSVTLEGGFAWAETKTAFTDAEAPTNKLVWSKDDAIGIFTVAGTTTNINYKASLFRSSIGATNGVFIPEEPVSEEVSGLQLPESGSDDFLVYYPYAPATDINVDDVKIHLTVSDLQTQSEVSDKEIGKNGFAYGVAKVAADTKKINFSLTHAMSYLRFVVASTDYSAYMLKSVQLYDVAGKAVLAGDYTFDVASSTIAAVNGATKSSAKVSLADGAKFQAIGSGKQELYLTLLPGADLTSATVYAVVTFVNDKKETVSIPVELSKKGKLAAGTMTTIDLGSVNASNNAFAWYEPVEKRNLVNGWCYGAQNTYFVERSADGNWNQVTFEVKARGDFSQVAEPKYVGIITSGDDKCNGLIRLSDGSTLYNDKPATVIGGDYTVTVEMAPVSENRGGSGYGVIAVYDKDYNLLWSFMINSYRPGEEPKANAYPGTGKSVMDRNLGAGRPATKEILPSKGPLGAWFQWGRPTPLMWSNTGQTHYNGALVNEDIDLKAALAKPFIKWGYAKGDGWNSNGNWYVGEFRNLWGGNDTEDYYDKNNDMGKTVYDPCPAGYRVASGDVIEYAIKYGKRNEVDHPEVTAPEDILFAKAGLSTVVIPLDGDASDYWVYLGAHWGSSGSWGNRTSRSDRSGALYWSNSPVGSQGYVLQHCYFSAGYGGADGDKDGKKTFTANRAQGLAVRCMVDTDNR